MFKTCEIGYVQSALRGVTYTHWCTDRAPIYCKRG